MAARRQAPRAVASPSPDAAPEMTRPPHPRNNAISASLGHSRLGIAPGAAQVQTGWINRRRPPAPSARYGAPAPRPEKARQKHESSSAITRSAQCTWGRSSTKPTSLVKLHRAGDQINPPAWCRRMKPIRGGASGVNRRKRSDRRHHGSETHQDQKASGGVVLADINAPHHQREEQDEGDQVFARDREPILAIYGNERQVQERRTRLPMNIEMMTAQKISGVSVINRGPGGQLSGDQPRRAGSRWSRPRNAPASAAATEGSPVQAALFGGFSGPGGRGRGPVP